MRVLILGSGGREHAMAHSVSKSKELKELFVLPGNYGTSKIATNVNIDIKDNKEIVAFAKVNNIDLTIVGPEVPIINGIVNDFEKEGLTIYSPTKEAGQIEGSKAFAKSIMDKYSIPTGEYEKFDDYSKAVEYVREKNTFPTVIKYDGLASGKGVYITHNFYDTEVVLSKLLRDKVLGNDKIIIEEFLDGEEFTLMAFVKGEKVYTMPVARDFKRIFEGDLGENTGGMGCICPYDKISTGEITEGTAILENTAKALVKEGIAYNGVLYGGFISTKSGVKVIEFNARFGDPETEVVLQKIKNSLLDIVMDILDDKEVSIELNDGVYTGVVLTADGYPRDYIKDIDMKDYLGNDFVKYHMSTYEKSAKVLSRGGRIMCITNSGENSKKSFEEIYKVIDKIENKNIHFRKDLKNY